MDNNVEPVDLTTPPVKKKQKKEDSEVDTARKMAIGKKIEFHANQAKRWQDSTIRMYREELLRWEILSALE